MPGQFIKHRAQDISYEFGAMDCWFVPGCVLRITVHVLVLLRKCKWEKRGVKKRREGDKEKGQNRWGGKGGEKGDGKGGREDLLPANKVNKITPTPQTSTGSARYGALLFNYSTISSASTMQKGRKKNKSYMGRRRNKCREKSKQKVHTSGTI